MTVTIRSRDRGFLLESEVRIPRPRGEVFEFFADARNLERITPPWLRFRIVTPQPVAMARGAVIDFRLRLRGVPVRWRSLIAAWSPPRRFVDEQVRGPYRWWRHEHLLLDRGGATIVRDRVRYGVPGGPLVHRLLVAPQLRRIFTFRRRRIAELLAAP